MEDEENNQRYPKRLLARNLYRLTTNRRDPKDSSSAFARERGINTARESLLAPLLPVLTQPLGNDNGPQQLLHSRTALRGDLGDGMIRLRLQCLHELLVIPRQEPRQLPQFTRQEDSCKSLGSTNSQEKEQAEKRETAYTRSET